MIFSLLTRASRSIVSAFLLSLLMLLSLTGLAHASSSVPLDVTPCLAAAPATQTVAVGQLAKVRITVNCLPPTFPSFVDVAWGDQTASRYPLCVEVCQVPPVVITATHSYGQVGDFHPTICVAPSPQGSVPLCVQVEILAIQLA